jgi:hypothetical protein
MIHRTIAAALLVGLASTVWAAGPALDQATGLATGRSADTAYDGSPARTAVQTQVSGALTTGGLAVETPPAAVTAASRPSLTAASVPSPSKDATKGPFITKRGLLWGAGAATIGGGIGWFVGGPIGALIGALAGFAIGFALSKILKKH